MGDDQDQRRLPKLINKVSKGNVRFILLLAGALLVLVCAAAAVSAVFCATAVLTCSVSPLSMSMRMNQPQQQSQNQQRSSSPAADGRRIRTCPVQYDPLAASPPLLLGGVIGACISGCQPRKSMWSDTCKLDPNSKTTWGLCEPQQRPALVHLAASVRNGSMLEFSPCDMYHLVKGRTIWLIGDSHMKNTYTAIRCIMLDFWDHSKGECAASPDPSMQLELHKAELYAPRKLSLSEITEPRCIHIIGGGRICFLHAVRGEVLVSGDTEKPGVLEFVQQNDIASSEDVFFVSTGRWYTHNCSDFEATQYNRSMWALATHYKTTKSRWPHVFFSLPPFDHTTCNITFDYKKERACPTAGQGTSLEMYSNISTFAHSILGSAGVHIVDNLNMTMPLHWAHLGHTRSFKNAIDCLHYCRPGLPEMDIWFLYNSMKQRGVKALTPSVVDTSAGTSPPQPELKCTQLKPFL